MPKVKVVATEGAAEPAPTIYPTYEEARAVKQPFIDFLKATNEPEAFPGLCHTKPPTQNPRFLLVVDEFNVDPLKRPDGEFIRCAACATKKKFKRGSLAYYPDEGVLRVVGNECGDERRAEAREEYKRRNTLDIFIADLGAQLPLVHSYMAKARAFMPAAKHAQELSLKLKTQGRSFGETILRAVKDGGGFLTIFASEVVEAGQEQRRVRIAKPEGLDFLRPMFQPGRRVEEALIRLAQADRGPPSVANRWLKSHRHKLEDLRTVHANLVAGLEKLREAERLVREVGAFLSKQNLDGIEAWSAERHTPLRARWSAIYYEFHAPPARGLGLQIVSLRPNWELLSSSPL